MFILSIVCLFLILNGKLPYAKETDLFEEIISKTGSNVIEYGVRVSFMTDSIEKEILEGTLKTMGYYNPSNNIISIKDNVYSIDFNNGDFYGFIQSVKQDDGACITLDIKEKSTINNINLLKKNIENAVGEKYKNIKYFLYLKSKLKQSNLTEVNNQIKTILKNTGAKAIDTVEINNGFSTIAYTKKYQAIKNNGKLIDFNYAVTSYNSGNYIIIGTPTIKETY
jgi:hypothetical protein